MMMTIPRRIHLLYFYFFFLILSSESKKTEIPVKKPTVPYNPWLTEIREVDISQLKGIREQHAKTRKKRPS